ncbi:MAG: M1 family metallopeptidase [Candidatus Eremiobacteraeota bacterium]|nr:M1 family metallopeptidase [Candidatus Eremiobacteraeota bacterium]
MSEHRPFALPGARPQYGPDKVVDVLHIDLELRPDLATKRLDGVCTTRVRAIEDGVARLVLDAVDLDVRAVMRADDRTPLAFRTTSETLEITVEPPLRAGDELTFAIEYAVENARRGIYFVEHEPRHVWTQSQDSDARYWFPCFDYPAEKQTTSATVIVPNGHVALANGALVARTEGQAETIYRYEQDVPHATYLVTLVAGPFSEIAQPHDRVPVFYYTLPGREADGERAFGNTPRMVDVFERTTGVPYPYARYSQIAVADFIFGGMENTTATTQTDRVLHDERAHLDYTADALASHELAHQWFGDLVTCRDWAQAWLNEGFATYFEAVWLEADKGWDEYLYDVYGTVQRYLEEDGERYRRPIVCNTFRDPIELFDRHLYEKGGAVLHMLRGELGWERMKRALRRYLTTNATRNVETIDLVRAIEAETGRNTRRFFAQWVERGGHPEIEVSYTWDGERKTALVTVTQKQAVDDDNPAYVFDLDVGFLGEGPSAVLPDAGEGPLPGETRVRLRVERAPQSFAVPLDREPALVRVDPAAWVLAAWTSALGTDMHAAVLRGDPSPIARIRAAKALAKENGRVAREALAHALATDPFWGVGVEVAAALGDSRAPSARAALLANVGHAHPKVRRAVADALGGWRDAEAASALLALRDDPSYFVVAASLHALGKTRDARAFDALAAGLATPSWNATIAAGAARGLGALADARALAPLEDALRTEQPEPLRRAAVGALAQLGTLVESTRTAAVEAVERALDDPAYLVRVSAYAAAEKLDDARLLGILDRRAVTENDGRLRRDAAEAAIRIREGGKKPAELARLREEVDKLRAESRTLREKLDALGAP